MFKSLERGGEFGFGSVTLTFTSVEGSPLFFLNCFLGGSLADAHKGLSSDNYSEEERLRPDSLGLMMPIISSTCMVILASSAFLFLGFADDLLGYC